MKKIILTAILIATLASCASITGSGIQNVKIDTVPSGAEVYVDGRYYTSPAIVPLKGKSSYNVNAEKEGYKNSYGIINGKPRIGAGVVGNIFNFTGIIGVAVDFFATGAGFKLDNEVNIKMREK